MKWYIISNETSLIRVKELLQELNIGHPIDPLLFLRLGYKNLSTQDKETYYILRSLSTLSKNSICQASIDYLATALNTTETTQYYRLKNLQKSKLIKILKNNNYYIIDQPYPDSTFVRTIVTLIRRKRLGNLINLYKTCNNPILRMTYLLNINRMKKRKINHYKLQTISLELKPEEIMNSLTSFNIIKSLS